MVLDGVMVILACTCLTACHAGWAFQGRWQEANFHFHPDTKKATASDAENASATSIEAAKGNEKGAVGVRETKPEGL